MSKHKTKPADALRTLYDLAGALNACEKAGLKVRPRQGIVAARGHNVEGYVIDFADGGWEVVARTPHPDSPPPDADEDGVD